MDGSYFFSAGVFDISFGAVELCGVGHADEVDVIDQDGKGENEFVAIGSDAESEGFGFALLAVEFLMIELLGSDEGLSGWFGRPVAGCESQRQ